jgi:hypothetical protein
MENKPNLKSKKMNINQLITRDYVNVPLKAPKKTNPI